MPQAPPRDAAPPPLEIWGGVEATIVRIGDRWRDQIAETGHRDRPEDLDRIAALGLRGLRYPVLWESVAPRHPEERDWSWHDARLGRLRRLGVEVIAGLVHHGSGPHYTDLLDPLFPEKLAVHARAVAARYPWIERFTPVNEPLTTARFSALYGHWYPHRGDTPAFLRALVNQCRGVVLAMQAIRQVTPQAQLVQTEDLGRVFSTPLLRYQAEFENERRWLSFDLLCGRVDPSHPLHGYLLEQGIGAGELAWLRDHARPPDILGMNHYLTSERYLDEQREAYPAWTEGGNGRHRYADAEAVRVVLPPGSTGPQARLRELWQRYRLPVAITEAHHGSTREEQLRWLMETWEAVQTLRGEGADVRALTVWALLGVVDWNSLLLRQDGFYEPGAFDIRSTPPRPTVLARATASLAHGRTFRHPVLDTPGWWRRPGRHYRSTQPEADSDGVLRPLLIAGGGGRLARLLLRCCLERGLPAVALPHAALEAADAGAVRLALAVHRPWAVVNAAGRGPQAGASTRDNVEAAAVLAAACAAAGLPLLQLSTAEVFDARDGTGFTEADPPHPRSSFGHAKATAERRVLAAHPGALVIRAGCLVEPGAAPREAAAAPAAAISRVDALARAMLDLLVDGESGIWHLTHPPLPGEAPGEGDFACLESRRGQVMPPLTPAEREALWPTAAAAAGLP